MTETEGTISLTVGPGQTGTLIEWHVRRRNDPATQQWIDPKTTTLIDDQDQKFAGGGE